jgi:hypothetical protein
MDLKDRTPLILRMAAVAALAGMFITHAIGVVDKLNEVLYLGFGYALILVVSVVCAVLLMLPSPKEQRVGWYVGGLLALSTLFGYFLTRTIGLPQATEDKNNWNESFAVWSTVAEGVMLLLSVIALFTNKQHGPRTSDQMPPT